MSPEAGISGSPQNPEAARMTKVPFPSRAFAVRKAEAPRDCLLPPNSRQGLPASVYTSCTRGQNTHPADECPRASRWRAQVRSGGRGHAHRARARWPRAGRSNPSAVPTHLFPAYNRAHSLFSSSTPAPHLDLQSLQPAQQRWLPNPSSCQKPVSLYSKSPTYK